MTRKTIHCECTVSVYYTDTFLVVLARDETTLITVLSATKRQRHLCSERQSVFRYHKVEYVSQSSKKI